MLAQGARILIGDGSPLTLETGDLRAHPGGRSYPAQLDFRWQGREGAVSLALRNPRLIEASSLLALLPVWQRRLARLVTNPYYFRFNAELRLEIDLAGLHAEERGPALYELMLLR